MERGVGVRAGVTWEFIEVRVVAVVACSLRFQVPITLEPQTK